MPKQFIYLVNGGDPPDRTPDLSYMMTDQEMRDGARGNVQPKYNDIVMETIIKRTEREAETRRERFEFIDLVPMIDAMAYTVNLWVESRGQSHG